MDMDEKIIFAAGSTAANRYAVKYLKDHGIPITDSPGSNIRYLLLDIPSFGPEGFLRGGGHIEKLLKQLPGDITVCGGNLSHPSLNGYKTVDFLKDETYLCENAYITAECALDVALPYLNRTVRGCQVLIIGWGRIGKCLALVLQNLGAELTVAARNPKDRAMIRALGYNAAATDDLPAVLGTFNLLYNTVPCPVLSAVQMENCREDCIKIELASKDGIAGEEIVIARGLPGIHMPESSGKLIADTFLRLCFGR